jgi:hypothetical protein
MRILSAYFGLVFIITGIIFIIRSIVEFTPIYTNYILLFFVLGSFLFKPYYKEKLKGKQMRTLADFKRKLTIGTKLETIYHKTPVDRDIDGTIIYESTNLGIAEVSVVNKTNFAVKRLKKGKFVDSWCDFPKASECTIVDSDTIEIYENDTKNDLILTYRFINE